MSVAGYRTLQHATRHSQSEDHSGTRVQKLHVVVTKISDSNPFSTLFTAGPSTEDDTPAIAPVGCRGRHFTHKHFILTYRVLIRTSSFTGSIGVDKIASQNAAAKSNSESVALELIGC
ncbi:uncharacterized protein BDZ83DRAFT_653521 [Colletotrichum acutatum]|uniref:Uncharacterized protein n=1 Tax=Glomerella acutata TaxID=27357 RepID=A0AAD8UKD7_GLOAC|nr:uncharacterized protein BDZ83DRAFT_653521 [Colletotrichum acutatum]KAK1722966.1 hypothetical protein BDZ83DRAFT_653521 [Colletotrichum acutatum]